MASNDDRSTEVDSNEDKFSREARVVKWSEVYVWKDGMDGRRRKVRSKSELASAMQSYRDTGKFPEGYHHSGMRLVTGDCNISSLSDEHVYIHAYTIKYYLHIEGRVTDIYDIREVALIAESLESEGKLPEKVSFWPFVIDYEGVDAAAKGATVTLGEIVNRKRVRF